MSATTRPARAILGELAIDIAFATGADRQTCDDFQHVRLTWSGAHRAKEDLDLAVQLVDSLIEFDVPAVQPSANHDATFHARQHSSNAAKVADHAGPQRAYTGKSTTSPSSRAAACAAVVFGETASEWTSCEASDRRDRTRKVPRSCRNRLDARGLLAHHLQVP
jgi:hypothetical protein